MEKLPLFLKLKGTLESDDGGETWFVSRIDYLTGADGEHLNKEFLPVPEDWEPCQLVLRRQDKSVDKK